MALSPHGPSDILGRDHGSRIDRYKVLFDSIVVHPLDRVPHVDRCCRMATISLAIHERLNVNHSDVFQESISKLREEVFLLNVNHSDVFQESISKLREEVFLEITTFIAWVLPVLVDLFTEIPSSEFTHGWIRGDLPGQVCAKAPLFFGGRKAVRDINGQSISFFPSSL